MSYRANPEDVLHSFIDERLEETYRDYDAAAMKYGSVEKDFRDSFSLMKYMAAMRDNTFSGRKNAINFSLDVQNLFSTFALSASIIAAGVIVGIAVLLGMKKRK